MAAELFFLNKSYFCGHVKKGRMRHWCSGMGGAGQKGLPVEQILLPFLVSCCYMAEKILFFKTHYMVVDMSRIGGDAKLDDGGPED